MRSVLCPCLQAPSTALQPASPTQLGAKFRPLTPEQLEWFSSRGITKATLAKNKVVSEHRYCSALKQSVDHVGFPYYKDSAIVNVKYRAQPKHFTQVKGGQQVFYGYDEARVSISVHNERPFCRLAVTAASFGLLVWSLAVLAPRCFTGWRSMHCTVDVVLSWGERAERTRRTLLMLTLMLCVNVLAAGC